MKKTKKSILAIVIGFVSVFMLSIITDVLLALFGILPSSPQPLFDTPLLLLALSYRTLYTVFGGYITARLSPENKLHHVLILGVIGVLSGSIGTIIMQVYGPLWYSWGIVALSLPSVYAGYICYKYRTLCIKK